MYRHISFRYRIYGLTDMTAALQKVTDYTLVGPKNTYCFLDDIITVGCCSN